MLRTFRILTFAGSLAAALLAGSAQATPTSSFDGDFQLFLNTGTFGSRSVNPEFSRVRSFSFSLDFAGPLRAGELYTNIQLREVRYTVSGGLETNPPTPSGFSAFALIRDESREGPIGADDWRSQGSQVAFRISASANVLDGVQLDELDPIDKQGRILEIDAVEWGRLDRARYHPPQLWLFPNGEGQLRNSNNSSKDTGTVNPATLEEVHVGYGDEYITRLSFDPSQITIIPVPQPPFEPGPTTGPVPTPPVPEPGTALLLGFGLAGLAARRR